ncbi:MAG: flagellar motor protein MotB [Pseudomonadota bacterium]
MAGSNDKRPIIKRKKIVAGGGHHGGAWKVAYADFVTAMMAFFLLMWLLNATTEDQRKGLADYFSPTIPVARVSGGGDGMFNGQSFQSSHDASQDGVGGRESYHEAGPDGPNTPPDAAPDMAELETIEAFLDGNSGESDVADELLAHIRTRVTDEGLVIELFDRREATLFEGDTDQPTELMSTLLAMLAEVTGHVRNGIAVAAHTHSAAPAGEDLDNWDLSAARARLVRTRLADAGVAERRFDRVTGHGAARPATRNPMEPANRRVEIILLRSDR